MVRISLDDVKKAVRIGAFAGLFWVQILIIIWIVQKRIG